MSLSDIFFLRKYTLPVKLAFAGVVFSAAFCWFFGIIPFMAGYFGLLSLYKHQKSGSLKGKLSTIWGFRIGWAGVICSLLFFVYYLVSIITGAFIRW